jgi:inhibitor of KinA sporulation pathway (predicted exonuclease)
MINEAQYYLVVDLECTCCDDDSFSRREREIIEIGAIMVDSTSLLPVEEWNSYVKPVRHPILTEFCTNLTSITQADVDSAPYFPDALKAFQKWIFQYPNFLFCSWGDFDKRQLRNEATSIGITNPCGSTHLNLKKEFSKRQNLPRKYGMAGAISLIGGDLKGKHHRGIDDVRNMCQLLPYIFGSASIVGR